MELDQSVNDLDRLRFALILGLAICVLGVILSLQVSLFGLSSQNLYVNSFHVLFVRNETLVFFLLFGALLLVRTYLFSSRFLPVWPCPLRNDFLRRLPWLGSLALGVVFLAWLGDFMVLHSFPLSNDEYLPRFQAQIFLSGKIKADMPIELREFGKALTPIFVSFNPEEGTWVSSYLPVYALLRTGFLALGVESLTNPFLAGLSIVLLAAIARRMWPQEQTAPFIAVILLASSSQFLVTSMTSYAMPAHLCFNLAWLYFYIRGDRLGDLVTPWIGFFALGLHNPFVHALFVAPFLIMSLWQRNWRLICYFVFVYATGCILWYFWWTRVVLFSSDDMSVFQLPVAYQLLIQPMNLTLLFAWQSFTLTVLAFLSLHKWRYLTGIFRPLAIGCILTLLFYCFFPYDQVLGWGYRFFYGVLGNLVLLAVAGWYRLRESVGARKAWGFVLIGTALAVLVQFPLRCIQVESFVRPFAKSAQYVQSLPQSFVVIDPEKVWFAQLLVRNDPLWSTYPKVLFSSYLTENHLNKLSGLGEVHAVQPAELAKCGLHTIAPRIDAR